jgi:lysophospholipase L1-like esterase
MANQVTSLVQEQGADYIGVHGEFGENGQCLSFLVKDAEPVGVNGRAFEATLLETEAIARLAEAEGKSYGVAALIVTHGECDSGNTAYAERLRELPSDYNADIKAITGQSEDILMIVSQQNSIGIRSAATLAQWRVGVDHPEQAVCSGPKYQYPYAADNIHLNTDGYRMLGEKYGQVYFERVVMGRDWRPLEPARATRSGRTITVDFSVPVPPLELAMDVDVPHADKPEWAAGNGFEVIGAGQRITIESVEIACNSVRIHCAEDLPADVTVGYGMRDSEAMQQPFNGTTHWGRLRDSDPFVGSVTGEVQPNYAVAFELAVE